MHTAMLVAPLLIVFPLCMLWAAGSDMLSMTISNRIPVILVAAFAVTAPLTGMAWAEFGLHFMVGAIVLAVTFALFAIGAMGGGDAKLLAATAVWFGYDITMMRYLVDAAFIGGLLTVLLIALRCSPIAGRASGTALLRHCADKQAGIPYGIALGLAGLMVYPDAAPVRWVLAHL